MPRDLPVIHLVAGARPNFMKVAPLYHQLKRQSWCKTVLVHTGQHYDAEMSDAFLRDLRLPRPDFHLGAGSGSHAEQTSAVMIAYERLCVEEPPNWTIVVGDVNSTLACTLVAKKLCLMVAHLEAGLRSGDREMPEEINRILTDSISDLLWTPSPDADQNLIAEGIPASRIHRVGNIMLDSFEMLRSQIESDTTWKQARLADRSFGIVTLHRPSNVDDPNTLQTIVNALRRVARHLPIVFPMHPRTRGRLESFGLLEMLSSSDGIHLMPPLGYIAFMGLVHRSTLAITDSGGVQEETTYLDIPCLTLRNTTERPITVTQGTNRLVKPETLNEQVETVLAGSWPKGSRPDLWDGQAASRIAENLEFHLDGTQV